MKQPRIYICMYINRIDWYYSIEIGYCSNVLWSWWMLTWVVRMSIRIRIIQLLFIFIFNVIHYHTAIPSFTVTICHHIICCHHHPFICMSASLSLFPDDGSCMLPKRWKISFPIWLVCTNLQDVQSYCHVDRHCILTLSNGSFTVVTYSSKGEVTIVNRSTRF